MLLVQINEFLLITFYVSASYSNKVSMTSGADKSAATCESQFSLDFLKNLSRLAASVQSITINKAKEKKKL